MRALAVAMAVAMGWASCQAQDLKPIPPPGPRARNLSLERLLIICGSLSASTARM
jgi:hypothetical protein